MPAYMVVNVYLRDTQWVEDYVANVPAILRSYGGEYLAVSNSPKVFEGDGPVPDQVALFTFPSVEAMTRFVESEEYRPYKESRLSQSSASIIGLET
jgi:uncharacterized protein (DUF1330 family)